jgi:hypothetical protein
LQGDDRAALESFVVDNGELELLEALQAKFKPSAYESEDMADVLAEIENQWAHFLAHELPLLRDAVNGELLGTKSKVIPDAGPDPSSLPFGFHLNGGHAGPPVPAARSRRSAQVPRRVGRARPDTVACAAQADFSSTPALTAWFRPGNRVPASSVQFTSGAPAPRPVAPGEDS